MFGLDEGRAELLERWRAETVAAACAWRQKAEKEEFPERMRKINPGNPIPRFALFQETILTDLSRSLWSITYRFIVNKTLFILFSKKNDAEGRS